MLTESMGRAWWSVAAQDRNQQRKQRLDHAAEHAKLLSAFLREFGVRQKEILASSGSPIPWMRWMRGCGCRGTALSSDASW